MILALLLIALFLLGTAAVALSLRNLIYSILLLVGAWAGIAAFYLWAGAEFVAFAQILVYVGAVSMVVLFAVLLTRQGDTAAPVEFASLKRLAGALVVAGGVASILFGAILGTPFGISAPPPPAEFTVKQLGRQLMHGHAPALLVIGVILTVALLGAVAIASTEKSPAHPEDAS